MPSYIEIKKQATFPPSSSSDKMIFGIKTNDKAALTDHLGNTVEIGGGGGGTGIQIPTPMISLTATSSQIGVYFLDQGFDYTTGNPELFLFRWRNKRRSRILISPPNNTLTRIKPSGWVHPTTEGSEVKWQGWKFFNGLQKRGSTIFTGRTTEWSIPPTIKPYEKFNIDFNRFMFWRISSSDLDLIDYDINVFANLGYGSFSPTIHENIIGPTTYKIKLGGYRDDLGVQRYANIIKYSLAVAVDNPNATKTNGLCPKIFGSFSEPFYTVFGLDFNGGNVFLTKSNYKNHKHIIKNSFN